ncbi:hypothetical protein AB0M64_18230 [Streptomyces sp. NPDC051771]|uniref:hypothetical protein n=1 Tax=Streptomyces sp. NPDC051771 TaxID=3154847 RepID=UPI00341BB884
MTVWLEREGEPGAVDEVIVERLALGVELLEACRRPEGGFDAVVDPARPVAERVSLLAKRRITPATRVRIPATPAEAADVREVSAIVPTRYGLLRATLDTSGTLTPPERAGYGTWVCADRAPNPGRRRSSRRA